MTLLYYDYYNYVRTFSSKFNNSVQVPEIKYRSSTGCAVKVQRLGKSIIPICSRTSSKFKTCNI